MNIYLQHYWGVICHKFWIMWFTIKVCNKLIWSAILHDISKFGFTESKEFIKVNHKLKDLTYGSEEYMKILKKDLKKALKHHYKHNSHHPEHYKYGFSGMSLLDKICMLIDWKASTKRHKDGDILKSIDHNMTRFGYTYRDKEFLLSILYDLGIDRKR